MYEHRQVPVTFGDKSFTVDEGMEALICGLWGIGIQTTNCCQGTAEDWRSAYLSMEAEHFSRFMVMFEDEIEIAREARRLRVQIHEGENFIACWHIDMRESISANFYPRGDRWVVNVALRFPPSFVPVLTAAVRARLVGVA